MEINSVRKLYIDSRFRLDGSKSSSDMEFELNRSITLPRNGAGFVTDIHLMKLVQCGRACPSTLLCGVLVRQPGTAHEGQEDLLAHEALYGDVAQ